MIAHRDVGDVVTDFHHLARRFVAERRVTLARRDTSQRDVERIGAADAARAHLDQDILGARRRHRNVENLRLARCSHHRHPHRHRDPLYPASKAAMSRVTTSANERSPKVPPAQCRTPSLTCICAR